MRTRIKTVGNVLVAAGAVVGVATVTAIATGYEIRLTPEMIELLTYKALGAAAIGLIIAGTWIARGGTEKHRDASRSSHGRGEDLSEGPVQPAFTESESVETKVHRRELDDAGR